MRIERLEPSKHKEGRWLVWLDDGALLRVGEGDVVSLGLYQGRELTDSEAAALSDAARQSKLDQRALELLSARPMSRKELLDKLCAPPRRRRGPGEEAGEPDRAETQREEQALREAARRCADRMERSGLLNDREYAGAVVRHYAAKGYGERKLRDELYRRGVPRQLWDEALEEQPQAGETLDRLARKKLAGAPPTRESLKKAGDYLARRGFGWSEIAETLERYKDEYED